MRILHLLLAVLFVILLPVPDKLPSECCSCLNADRCVLFRCSPGMRQIGTCGSPLSKCCR
ncbi:PREDICTED: beta-defensin 1-like [Ceratotherium simum simum]|uniref:Beta-defensin 1-like n=1 Tax=Ceratotherium simum simum TaxID=73337 RepID=A0ABM1DGF8_CERSS|nr:PREDICTED: beta-defensin 1-like [Ceratotherium simum simum]